MAGSKSTTSPTEAFAVWVEMGDKRSIKGLERRLHEKGRTIGRSTLIGWHKRYGWADALESALAEQATKVTMAAEEVVAEVEEKGAAFTPDETFAGVNNALHGMTAAIAVLVTQQVSRIIASRSVVDLQDLFRFAKLAGDMGGTVATLYAAQAKAAPPDPKRDPETGILEGHAVPVEDNADSIMAMLLNPPMERPAPPK